jgi:uncharacterized protein (DUF885 family)
MNRIKLTTALLVLIASSLLAAKPSAKTGDAKFEALAGRYIEKMLEMSPETATGLGDHRYDARLDDYSKAGVDRMVKFGHDTLAELQKIDLAKLSATNRVDARILRDGLESQNVSLVELRSWEWNPLNYNAGGALNQLVARDFAPAEERLRSLKGRLEALPGVLEAAKANLRNPPRIHTETAIQQNKGTISLVRGDIDALVDKAPQMRAEIAPAQQRAIAALESYGSWLEKELLPRSTGDFRLGDAKFRKKLRYALGSDLTREQVLASAKDDLLKTQAAMYETALGLYRQYYPGEADSVHLADRKLVIKKVLDRLAEKHPTNDTIVARAKQDLISTTEFVRAQKLVTVPDDPVQITVTPEFNRGVAVASCSPPGALEKNPQTFYYISPTPASWTPQRAESFFREYNDYMLEEVTIHEAMPGHYLQLALANRFKAPTLIRSIYRSGTFTEGWATYAEQVMAEKGYGGAEVRMQQLKMRLRLIINAMIDQGIHTAQMSEKQAIDLMMNEGFQEEGEAAGKWRRACLTSAQLSTYYVGNLEMNDIRRRYEKKLGTQAIDLKKLHDTMLSFGSPAPKYVKEMMGL